jgi:hypothetical protein
MACTISRVSRSVAATGKPSSRARTAASADGQTERSRNCGHSEATVLSVCGSVARAPSWDTGHMVFPPPDGFQHARYSVSHGAIRMPCFDVQPPALSGRPEDNATAQLLPVESQRSIAASRVEECDLAHPLLRSRSRNPAITSPMLPGAWSSVGTIRVAQLERQVGNVPQSLGKTGERIMLWARTGFQASSASLDGSGTVTTPPDSRNAAGAPWRSYPGTNPRLRCHERDYALSDHHTAPRERIRFASWATTPAPRGGSACRGSRSLPNPVRIRRIQLAGPWGRSGRGFRSRLAPCLRFNSRLPVAP